MSQKRIVSLLPSCTEIVCGLGCADQLVGRSHECDFPQEIQSLPVCTFARIDSTAPSAEIDGQIKSLLQRALSIYEVDAAHIEQLRPDLILTQDQCEVCAVSLADLRKALPNSPEILSVSPMRLADIWKDIQTIADAIGVGDHGREWISQLKHRVVDVIQKTCMIKKRPTVACIEWLDPLMAAGNWVPEMVELAGGHDVLGVAGKHSAWMDWPKLTQSNPDIIVLMPCGFDLDRTRHESQSLAKHPGWHKLPAVKSNNIFAVDGNHYFNRPGPRVVESIEILAEILQPKLFSFGHEGRAWSHL
ncbi:MAG TPA: cobalamin-binding protein [Verrucomicrobiae bacterium]|jgi:iron complex transport system substrate-binding protein